MTAVFDRDALSEALGQTGRGGRAAFRRVYEATSAKLMGVCLRILSDRQLAEDVLQEIYLTVWNKAASFDLAGDDCAEPVDRPAALGGHRAQHRAGGCGL